MFVYNSLNCGIIRQTFFSFCPLRTKSNLASMSFTMFQRCLSPYLNVITKSVRIFCFLSFFNCCPQVNKWCFKTCPFIWCHDNEVTSQFFQLGFRTAMSKSFSWVKERLDNLQIHQSTFNRPCSVIYCQNLKSSSSEPGTDFTFVRFWRSKKMKCLNS